MPAGSGPGGGDPGRPGTGGVGPAGPGPGDPGPAGPGDPGTDDVPELWVERLARLAGMERLAAWLAARPAVRRATGWLADRRAVAWLAGLGPPGGTPWWLPDRSYLAPFCYLAALLVVDVLVLNAASILLSDRVRLFPDRFWFGVPAGMVLAFWGTLALRDAYVRAVRRLPTDDALTEADLLALLDGPQKPVLVATAILGYAGMMAADPVVLSAAVEIDGPVVLPVRWLLQWFGYLVVVGEFAAIVVAAQLLLPVALWRRRPALDLGDRYGGLRPVGRLLRSTSALYFAGLGVYTLVAFLPALARTAIPQPLAFSGVVFPVLWLAGVALYLLPVALLHRYVAGKKARHLDRIRAAIREIDPAAAGRPLPEMEPPGDRTAELHHRYLQLREVRAIREYPTDVGTLAELLAAALLPLVLQLLLRATVGFPG